MRLSISETANLFGISVRTLHYYDEIGLLKPSETSNAGYRYYTDEAIILLQQILFYRELDFPLKEIAAMLNNPQYDRQKALLNHHSLLVSKRERLDALIHLVEQTMGGKAMTKPKISSVPPPDLKRQYAEEARKRWGHTAEYAQSKQNEDSRPDSEQADAEKEADAIFSAFAKCRAEAPDSMPVQALVSKWKTHISRYYYPCTNEMLAQLGEMYVRDARFQKNLDQFGEGTAQLMRDAIRIYVKK